MSITNDSYVLLNPHFIDVDNSLRVEFPDDVVVKYVPERTCHVVARYEARSRAEIGRERVKLSCGHVAERHSNYCAECGARVIQYE